VVADAAKLPFAEGSFDCVVAYNALMDMDDMPATVLEAGRVLRTGGGMCVCVTHPMIDAGRFEAREADARFIIDGDYLVGSTVDEPFERAGLRIRFRGRRWPLEAYSMALESAGFVIERIREPRQRAEAVAREPAERLWQRLPNFLFIPAVKAR
jgi:SAM-dependent methyltransferase